MYELQHNLGKAIDNAEPEVQRVLMVIGHAVATCQAMLESGEDPSSPALTKRY